MASSNTKPEEYLDGESARMLNTFIGSATREPNDGFVMACARRHPDFDVALSREKTHAQFLTYCKELLGLKVEKKSKRRSDAKEGKRW